MFGRTKHMIFLDVLFFVLHCEYFYRNLPYFWDSPEGITLSYFLLLFVVVILAPVVCMSENSFDSFTL